MLEINSNTVHSTDVRPGGGDSVDAGVLGTSQDVLHTQITLSQSITQCRPMSATVDNLRLPAKNDSS